MAFHENTCDAFTTAFAALSLVLAVAATGGSSWVAYELYGYDQVEAGLWEFCEGEGGLRECLPYSSVKGKKNVINGSNNIGSNSKSVLKVYVVALYAKY